MRNATNSSSSGSDVSDVDAARVRLINQLKYLNIKQKEICQATGIPQPNVSRIMRGVFARIEGYAKKVVDYANDREAKVSQGQVASDDRIRLAANAVSDGSPEDVDSVVELLRAVKRIKDLAKATAKK